MVRRVVAGLWALLAVVGLLCAASDGHAEAEDRSYLDELWPLLRESEFEKSFVSGLSPEWLDSCQRNHWLGILCQQSLDVRLAQLIERDPCNYQQLVSLLVEAAPSARMASDPWVFQSWQQRLLLTLPYVPARLWPSIFERLPRFLWDPDAPQPRSLSDRRFDTIRFAIALRGLLLTSMIFDAPPMTDSICVADGE